MGHKRLTETYFSYMSRIREENPCFRGPFGIPPPDGWKCRATVLGQRVGSAVAVPACRAQLVIGKLRYDVVVPQQDTVERPGGCHQFAAALGKNHALVRASTAGFLMPT